ncbi:putative tail component [Rhizobium phage vB_RglS_P106B]|uniref:Putative tail component n=1 Tax=Rhizobium phage vB_RglS_P106B TaxID=1458697 RepID=W6E8G0_9CAUD|nr:tail protein [Rhizobium phage vB_RglS_P106B]AHJ10720.1 putative tail component [Rhizobium phage vB_RglS_P106B]
MKIRVPSLVKTNKKNGDMHGSTVEVAFDIKTSSGSYVQVGTMIIEGKTTSPYERAKRLTLPAGGAPWSLRVRRLTDDNESQYLQNDTYLSSFTIVHDAKLSYPDTAYLAWTIDAQAFGENTPSRVALVKGLITDVPVNYNPETRVYTGLWNGTFKKAWHNNPAWVLWDIMTNKRYGLGDLLSASNVDKIGLYTIGQYCDQLVPDGNGGMEPRFAFNGVINTKTDAAKALDAIASSFRGMIYWGAGSVMFTQDAPGTPRKIVTPANVVGQFEYTGSALKARHTSVLVSWNDPNDLGRAAVEVVQRDDLIQTFGFRETEIAAYGATSRGQARRAGEWLLDTEEFETETVTYTAALDHADVRPGDLISVHDPDYVGGRYGGRLVSATLDTVTLDQGVTLQASETYSFATILPDGSMTDWIPIINAPGTNVSVLSLGVDLDAVPINGAMWIITASNVAPRTFRVISNTEKADNLYEITALFHDKNKYARIERGVQLEPPSYILEQTGPLKMPSGLNATEYFKDNGTASVSAVTLSWTAPNDPRITGYDVQVWGVNDVAWSDIIKVSGPSLDQYPTDEGAYKFRVRSTALFLKPTNWIEGNFFLNGPNQQINDVTGFKIANTGANTLLSWTAVTPAAMLDHYEIRFNPSVLGANWNNSSPIVDGIAKTSTQATVSSRVGTYLIKAVSVGGVLSINPALITSEIGGYLDVNVVETLDEDPTFPGLKADVVAVSSSLRLLADVDGNYPAEGYYYFSDDIDLGTISQVNVSIHCAFGSVSSAYVMEDWIPLSSVLTMAVISNDVNVITEYSATQDNPTAVVTRASTGTYFDADGVMKTAAIDVPRYNYNPASLGDMPVLLAEPARTNLLVQAQVFQNAAWTKVNSVVTLNVINGLDGTLTADKMDETAVNDIHYLHQTVSASASLPYTFSVFAGAAERDCILLSLTGAAYIGDAYFDLLNGVILTQNGAIIDAEIQDCGDGFYRCSITADTVPGDTTVTGLVAITQGTTFTYLGEVGKGVYLWGAQIEQGSGPTSYMASGASQVSRAAETIVSQPTWTDWTPFTYGRVLFRAIKFRARLLTTDLQVSPNITELNVVVDVDDRVANGKDVSALAAGSRILFNPAFMAAPSVHIDGQGLSTGDYHRVTNVDETGFDIRFFNSAGTGKAVTFDWIAKGYGYQI